MRDTQTVKKVVASAVIVGTFVLYSLTHGRSASSGFPLASSSSGSPPPSQASATAVAGGSTPAGTGTAGTPTTSHGRYKDGTYTGSVTDAQWGYVQVQAVIQHGAITNVRFLQYPNDRSRSIDINSYADPQLISEAIQAQSAQVDVVTGATDSSDAFIQSLNDALSHAVS